MRPGGPGGGSCSVRVGRILGDEDTGAPRAQIGTLASLAFMEQAQDLRLLSPSGMGKMHPAAHLCVIRRGIRTSFPG